MSPERILEALFDRLWDNYCQRVPHAESYRQLVAQHGGRVANDHIAFRSFNTALPGQPPGYQAFLRVLLPLGYMQAGTYDFPDTHLRAVHLEHADENLPRIFISQLEVDRLPAEHAALLRAAVQDVVPDWKFTAEVAEMLPGAALSPARTDALVASLVDFFGRPWPAPPRRTVLALNEVSQYAAWTLLHGNAVNHFTAYINRQAVPAWPDIEATVAGLRAAGVPMKDAIEGERGSRLRQTATQAARGRFPVREDDGRPGELEWTYAYYELAERGTVTGPDGHTRLFTGFLGPQTPGLFEMTRVSG